jgi:hypothetical protein
MRTHLTFRHPAPFVPLSEQDDGVLSTDGAKWFVELLGQIGGVSVDAALSQEDWGVAIGLKRGDRVFWIGLSASADNEWIAHLHHASLLQRLSAAGQRDLDRLTLDLHDVLERENSVTDLKWYWEHEFGSPRSQGAAAPQ